METEKRMENATIDEVRNFWEKTPLWTGESAYSPGSKEFFTEHRATVIDDCFAGELDERIFPKDLAQKKILDLGCGPGFWIVEFAKRGARDLVAADLTEAALSLARKRFELFGVRAELRQENAEKLSFANGTFDHVNCQGVIHHSPDTPACVREIARVIKPGGTASLSVYYTNIFLKAWPILKWPAKLIAAAGAKLKGRGRDKIFLLENVDDIVRMYDGDANPVGKAYTEAEFRAMVEPYFTVECVFLHFFPARSLPFPIPAFLHRFLDRNFGFLVYMNLRKKSA